MPDFRSPAHLPNLRVDRQPPGPNWLPRQRRGRTPQMIGRYPDFDVLENSRHWDSPTREVVLARLERPAPLRFFGVSEEPTLRALCDTLLAQDREPRVPVPEMIDSALAEGRRDGFRYQDMPDDGLTWRQVLAGMDGLAQRADWQNFASATQSFKLETVARFARADLNPETLGGLNPKRAFSVCMRMVVSAFYSHPWAWNEIGFGGPAYPRGYMRLGPVGVREPYESPAAVARDPVGPAKELGE